MVCSDGLWNYCSDPEALSALVRSTASARATPVDLAEGLVDWANTQGGEDNITVALARVGHSPHPAPTAAAASTAPASAAYREEGIPDGNVRG
jgi:serine/threonine protein phosphatase PrpC